MIGIIFIFKFALVAPLLLVIRERKRGERGEKKERDVKRNFISSTSNVT